MAFADTDDGAKQLATARLELVPFSPSDTNELLRIFRNHAVRRYLLDDDVVPDEWIVDEIESSRQRFENGSMGLWSVRLREGPEIVGFVGFRDFFEPPQLQLLYGLIPEYWGRGLATESARAVCGYAFDKVGWARIRAATDLPNTASAKVLLRLGMVLDRTTEEESAGTAFYSMDRGAWEGLHGPSGSSPR